MAVHAPKGAIHGEPSSWDRSRRVCQPGRNDLTDASDMFVGRIRQPRITFWKSGASAQQENEQQDRDRHAEQPHEDVASLAFLRRRECREVALHWIFSSGGMA